ncbi:MAG: hypothetical protein WC197_00880 [Candidatus Gastranaerophilaceae bacterium]|jgi:hypothetical protein
MDKSWFRIILTWVVIVPDLILSYHALRNPFANVEMTSLALNFIATTVLFYVYMDLGPTPEPTEGEEGASSSRQEEQLQPKEGCKLAFTSLIEDILVWTGLFFILYNIVPVTLYLHNIISKYI